MRPARRGSTVYSVGAGSRARKGLSGRIPAEALHLHIFKSGVCVAFGRSFDTDQFPTNSASARFPSVLVSPLRACADPALQAAASSRQLRQNKLLQFILQHGRLK